MKKVTVIGGDYQIIDMFNKHKDYYVNKDANSDADVVCFIGGADVAPQFYGQQKLAGTSVSTAADNRDYNAWKFYAARKQPPMFVGICRGGQFLNVMNGGKMWQHVDGHAMGPHAMIDLLTGKEIKVTSTHHQMMRANTDTGEVIGIAMEARNFADDKVSVASKNPKERTKSMPAFDTEVVWYKDTRTLCFQPHPEYNQEATRNYFFELMEKLY